MPSKAFVLQIISSCEHSRTIRILLLYKSILFLNKSVTYSMKPIIHTIHSASARLSSLWTDCPYTNCIDQLICLETITNSHKQKVIIRIPYTLALINSRCLIFCDHFIQSMDRVSLHEFDNFYLVTITNSLKQKDIAIILKQVRIL